MRIGFLIPTNSEAQNWQAENRHVTSAGYGAGKAAACAAAAKLVYECHCDTVVIWGLAGGLSPRVEINDIVIGTHVAYRDYDVSPLYGSTGLGWVEGFAENLFAELDPGLAAILRDEMKRLFPGRRVLEGKVCCGDQFVKRAPGDPMNRVEAASDVVDMESAAVAQFCRAVDPAIKVGVVRVVSDHADRHANVDFTAFLDAFAEMNGKMLQLRTELKSMGPDLQRIREAIRDYPDFPKPGVLFRDMWGLFADRTLFEGVCHDLCDRFRMAHPGERVTKVAGLETRGFILGFELARMFGVPFVPLRKKGKLPGAVASETYATEYSETCLEAQKSAMGPGDRVLLADDIIATGGSLLAGKRLAEACGAECAHCLAIGRIAPLDGAAFLEKHGLSSTWLLDL